MQKTRGFIGDAGTRGDLALSLIHISPGRLPWCSFSCRPTWCPFPGPSPPGAHSRARPPGARCSAPAYLVLILGPAHLAVSYTHLSRPASLVFVLVPAHLVPVPRPQPTWCPFPGPPTWCSLLGPSLPGAHSRACPSGCLLYTSLQAGFLGVRSRAGPPGARSPAPAHLVPIPGPAHLVLVARPQPTWCSFSGLPIWLSLIHISPGRLPWCSFSCRPTWCPFPGPSPPGAHSRARPPGARCSAPAYLVLILGPAHLAVSYTHLSRPASLVFVLVPAHLVPVPRPQPTWCPFPGPPTWCSLLGPSLPGAHSRACPSGCLLYTSLQAGFLGVRSRAGPPGARSPAPAHLVPIPGPAHLVLVARPQPTWCSFSGLPIWLSLIHISPGRLPWCSFSCRPTWCPFPGPSPPGAHSRARPPGARCSAPAYLVLILGPAHLAVSYTHLSRPASLVFVLVPAHLVPVPRPQPTWCPFPGPPTWCSLLGPSLPGAHSRACPSGCLLYTSLQAGFLGVRSRAGPPGARSPAPAHLVPIPGPAHLVLVARPQPTWCSFSGLPIWLSLIHISPGRLPWCSFSCRPTWCPFPGPSPPGAHSRARPPGARCSAPAYLVLILGPAHLAVSYTHLSRPASLVFVLVPAHLVPVPRPQPTWCPFPGPPTWCSLLGPSLPGAHSRACPSGCLLYTSLQAGFLGVRSRAGPPGARSPAPAHLVPIPGPAHLVLVARPQPTWCSFSGLPIWLSLIHISPGRLPWCSFSCRPTWCPFPGPSPPGAHSRARPPGARCSAPAYLVLILGPAHLAVSYTHLSRPASLVFVLVPAHLVLVARPQPTWCSFSGLPIWCSLLGPSPEARCQAGRAGGSSPAGVKAWEAPAASGQGAQGHFEGVFQYKI
ncbi:hypothetical protein NN561_013000 [Cricetulus griseus]